jgi:hypothetical protein
MKVEAIPLNEAWAGSVLQALGAEDVRREDLMRLPTDPELARQVAKILRPAECLTHTVVDSDTVAFDAGSEYVVAKHQPVAVGTVHLTNRIIRIYDHIDVPRGHGKQFVVDFCRRLQEQERAAGRNLAFLGSNILDELLRPQNWEVVPEVCKEGITYFPATTWRRASGHNFSYLRSLHYDKRSNAWHDQWSLGGDPDMCAQAFVAGIILP